MTAKLLTEHHLAFLKLKGGCTGLSESTLNKILDCWKITCHGKNYYKIKTNYELTIIESAQDRQEPMPLPIFAKWNIRLLPNRQVHYRFKGSWEVPFIFIHILIENSISKQWVP